MGQGVKHHLGSRVVELPGGVGLDTYQVPRVPQMSADAGSFGKRGFSGLAGSRLDETTQKGSQGVTMRFRV